jgi:hypothetical protein
MYLTNSYWGRKDPETGDDVEFTNDLFIGELLKQFEKTPEMKAGTALHKILELSQYGTEISNMIGIDGEMYKFDYCIDESVEIVLPTLRETRITKSLNNISINGIVDAISATTIWDHKFTKQIQYDKYANSWQWKVYLYITSLDNFKYNLFQGKVLEPTIEPAMNNIRIDKFEVFNFERYATMDREIEDLYTHYWYVLNKLKPLIIETAHKNNIIIKGLTT